MKDEVGTQDIARLMALSAEGQSETQADQTRFRQGLVVAWGIPIDAKVLEIGCGQGDMTAVLASTVGARGHVTAVDVAVPDYGAPVTIGQSAAYLKESPLGSRIDFQFAFDVLDAIHDFPPNTFDYVVLAHCSWYFSSRDALRQTLLRIRPWAKRLCFSEWNMEPCAFDQVAHLLSVLIQGQIEACGFDSDRNVKTPLSRQMLLRLLEETGWLVVSEAVVDTASLQDAQWEIADCLRTAEADVATLDVPLKMSELLQSQIDLLRALAAAKNNAPLPSYAILAERSPSVSTAK